MGREGSRSDGPPTSLLPASPGKGGQGKAGAAPQPRMAVSPTWRMEIRHPGMHCSALLRSLLAMVRSNERCTLGRVVSREWAAKRGWTTCPHPPSPPPVHRGLPASQQFAQCHQPRSQVKANRNSPHHDLREKAFGCCTCTASHVLSPGSGLGITAVLGISLA